MTNNKGNNLKSNANWDSHAKNTQPKKSQAAPLKESKSQPPGSVVRQVKNKRQRNDGDVS